MRHGEAVNGTAVNGTAVNGTAVIGAPVDDTVGIDAVGVDAVGTRTAGIDAAGIDVAGFDVAGIDVAQIARVTAMVGELARYDVGGLSQGDFLEAHDAVTRLGRMADALRARFAGDLARRSAPDLPGGGLARRQGYGNARDMVARLTGGSHAGAMRSIEAGLALMSEPVLTVTEGPAAASQVAGTPSAPRYPAVAEATLAGDLSVDAAGLITSGLETLADALPSDDLHALERRLVDKATHLAAHEVRRLVTNAVARADLRGHEERERRQHSERYIAWKEDHTGMVTFTGRLDAVTAAPIRTVIEQIVTHDFRARRDQDPSAPDQRTVGQMRADALFEICRHALGCKETDRSGVRTTIVVRMNLCDVASGRGLGTIDGTAQPVSVTQLRRLAGDSGIVPEVLGHEGEVLDFERTARVFTRAQRIALPERDGGCAKCHAPPEHCEAHHIRWWEQGGRSDLSNGVMLCTRCHHDIHRERWEIRARSGAVEFIPPHEIDPTRRPRPGGRAAIELTNGNHAKPTNLGNSGDSEHAEDTTSDGPALGQETERGEEAEPTQRAAA